MATGFPALPVAILVLEFDAWVVLPYTFGFHTIPRDTKDNRYSGHVGVPNKTNNQNSFKSTPAWSP